MGDATAVRIRYLGRSGGEDSTENRRVDAIAQAAGSVVRIVPSECPTCAAAGSGTGFLISESGHIATAKGVIAGVEERAKVFFPGVTEYVWSEEFIRPASAADVALVRVLERPATSPPLPLLRAGDQVRQGDDVVIVGYSKPGLPDLVSQTPPLVAVRGMIAGGVTIPLSSGGDVPLLLIDGQADEEMAGAPVLCAQTGAAIAVLTARPPVMRGAHAWLYALPVEIWDQVLGVRLGPQ